MGVIVGCSDSRVPPELLFGGVGLGQLFVARNAGNMVDTATMGTIEYGAEHLGAPLVVVLGHERCGAVVAACEVATKNTKLPGSIGPMVKPIVPAAMAMKGKPGDFVDNTVRESAKRTATKVAAQPDPGRTSKTKVVAARYDLDDGKVEFSDAEVDPSWRSVSSRRSVAGLHVSVGLLPSRMAGYRGQAPV